MRIERRDRISFALWAADRAGRVLPYFEGEHPEDDRPRNAGEAGRAWARGEIKVGDARAAARAADHAAATADMDAHAADYAVRAVTHAAGHADPAAGERVGSTGASRSAFGPLCFPPDRTVSP